MVIDKMNRGIILHDVNLQAMARKINVALQIPNFNASLRWIQNFKADNRISSRHITKFVSRRSLTNKERTRQQADQFVANVKV